VEGTKKCVWKGRRYTCEGKNLIELGNKCERGLTGENDQIHTNPQPDRAVCVCAEEGKMCYLSGKRRLSREAGN
jgi:hypothetical protein